MVMDRWRMLARQSKKPLMVQVESEPETWDQHLRPCRWHMEVLNIPRRDTSRILLWERGTVTTRCDDGCLNDTHNTMNYGGYLSVLKNQLSNPFRMSGNSLKRPNTDRKNTLTKVWKHANMHLVTFVCLFNPQRKTGNPVHQRNECQIAWSQTHVFGIL